jgi:hypothetical protein
VDAKNVKAARKQLFTDMNLMESKSVDDYIRYHSSHMPNRSKESVCMHREDANTISLSHVSVSEQSVSFRYADGSPCEAELGPNLSMKLISNPDDNLASASIAVT